MHDRQAQEDSLSHASSRQDSSICIASVSSVDVMCIALPSHSFNALNMAGMKRSLKSSSQPLQKFLHTKHSSAHLGKLSQLRDAREGRLPRHFCRAQNEPAVGGQSTCQQLGALLRQNRQRLARYVLIAHVRCTPHCHSIHRHLPQSGGYSGVLPWLHETQLT